MKRLSHTDEAWLSLRAVRALCLALGTLLLAMPPGFAQQRESTGEIELLYIRAEWADGTMALTDATWLARLDAMDVFADDYWVFHSSGAVTGFTPTVTDRLQLQGPAPTPATPLDPGDVRAEMISLAVAAGFVLADYDHVVLSYPSVAHTFSFGALGTPGTVWMPGSNPWPPGFVHEMGHAFGVGHASHWEGGSSILPGVPREGRDGLFMMGSEGGSLGGRSTINMPMRYRMGHTRADNIATADTSGVYRLYEFELPVAPANKLLALRVPIFGVSGGDWWISFAPTMVDRWAPFNSGGFAQGVIVQQLIGSITRSLDFTPQSQGGVGTNEEDYVDTRDGALQVGADFTFPGTDVRIRPVQTGVDGGLRWIDVEVERGRVPSPLLLREEFDGYAPGSLDDQVGRGLGLTKRTWSQTQGSGSFDIVGGLSGAHAVGLSSNGERGDLLIPHDVAQWGTGKLWFSCLYSESATEGHFWINGSASFDGALGHPWYQRTWSVNNATSPGFEGFGLGETHRMIGLYDWELGRTTLWIDETVEPVTDPLDPGFAPAATKAEVPPAASRWLLLSFENGTEGVVDDIRIGTTFASVIEVGQEYCWAQDCPCGNDTTVGGCANASGVGASLRSAGSASVSQDDLELRLEGLQPGQASILVMGGAPSSVPVGDGALCVGPGAVGLCRFPVVLAGGGGRATWSQIVATSAMNPACAISAGETRYFQGWYRDVGGPCGNGSNFSSARSVLFVP